MQSKKSSCRAKNHRAEQKIIVQSKKSSCRPKNHRAEQKNSHTGLKNCRKCTFKPFFYSVWPKFSSAHENFILHDVSELCTPKFWSARRWEALHAIIQVCTTSGCPAHENFGPYARKGMRKTIKRFQL